MNRNSRKLRIIKSSVPDELIWEEFWQNKSSQDKLDAAESIRTQLNLTSEKENVKQGLQRIFRVTKRV